MSSPLPTPTALVSDYAQDADMRELVELFVSELPARIEAFRAARNEQRLGDLRRLAHQMKGAAGGYGFPSMGRAAAVLEASLKQPEPPELDRLRAELDALIGLCDRAILGATVRRT